jgi:hypothetical protein
MVANFCTPNNARSISRRITVQTSQGIHTRLFEKQLKQNGKGTWLKLVIFLPKQGAEFKAQNHKRKT